MERLIDALERRFGRFVSLPGLTYVLVAAQLIVLVLDRTNPGFADMLQLDRGLVMRGQVWRLFSYVFIPASLNSPIFALFAVYWLYIMGANLEAQWGAFKYQVYWLIGVLLTSGVAMALSLPASNTYLMMSLFLAFATLWPDYEIRLFMLIPLKVKWLAFVDALLLLGTIILQDGWMKVLPLVAIGNYLLFFTPTLIMHVRNGALDPRRRAALRRFQKEQSREAEEPVKTARSCAVCGVTDADRTVDIRVCTCEKCGKPTEFCLAHARNH